MVTNISVRLDDEQLAEVDEMVAFLSRQAQGTTISRSAAVRAIILKGIAAIRSELGADCKTTK